MAPPHVSSFQRFAEQIPNHLEASIAFGLFMQSEAQWAAKAGNPSDAKYRNYQAALLTDHEIERYAKQARDLLTYFGSEAISGKRAELLKENLERYEGAAGKGHSRFRGWGVIEATLGAFLWTCILILTVGVIAKYAPIDLVDIVHKISGK
ncbi:MAG: hypothetical protein QOJ86_5486 [Bradyrhizobium sp.]|jgi:hypothetical protein|nr:hypothetical protein [Bradyrhizobium sp.]